MDTSNSHLIFKAGKFSGWNALNDTIMGGNSISTCVNTAKGLLFKGEVVEKDGGFVSCRSSIFSPSLDLSGFRGIEIKLDGSGRTYKFALDATNNDNFFTLSRFIKGNIRWVGSIATNKVGTTTKKILFSELKPVIRAREIKMPLRLELSDIRRIQFLYSKFPCPGDSNPLFQFGPFSILIRSISAFS